MLLEKQFNASSTIKACRFVNISIYIRNACFCIRYRKLKVVRSRCSYHNLGEILLFPV